MSKNPQSDSRRSRIWLLNKDEQSFALTGLLAASRPESFSQADLAATEPLVGTQHFSFSSASSLPLHSQEISIPKICRD